MKEKSDVQVMLKEAGILFLITVISGFLLGAVYEITKEPRAKQEELAVQEACIEAFPNVTQNLNFTLLSVELSSDVTESLSSTNVTVGDIYEADLEDGSFYGYVVEVTSSEGYGGDIVLYVGIESDGTVGGVAALEMSETAGLGMKAPEELFPQFAGKKFDSFSYTKTGAREGSNEVDAITAATVTTKAVTEAVNGGVTVGLSLLEGGGANE